MQHQLAVSDQLYNGEDLAFENSKKRGASWRHPVFLALVVFIIRPNHAIA